MVPTDGPATGVLTFLFTDLEGSTRTWEREPEAMDRWLARHDEMVVDAVVANHGRVFKRTGDGVCAVFAAAVDAARAARDIQSTLAAAGHEHVGPLRVRIALHTGEARERAGDFYGPTLNRCARLLDIGHGGQVLLSAAATALLGAAGARAGLALVDLGQHRLRDLQESEHVWQLAAPDLDRAFPPLRSLDTFVHNLPVHRSPFIGREAEQQALHDLLQKHRLVTVTGVGGCGKTRLALEVAARELDRFVDGVFFVDLSTVVEPSLVASTIATAVHASAGPGSSEERLTDFLSDRRALVVVDNCEHLLDASAVVVDRLLGSCPQVSVLATSREPLAIEGERVWRVPSLSLPEGDLLDEVAQSEAGRLFVDRAAAVRPGFALSADNSAAVAEVCRRLDGIPLALQLAAARVAHLAPGEIAARLSDRFRLLSTGRRGVQRQQTLQAALDWSHDLLRDPERRLLRRLSVFAGGWSLDAAQAVCARDDLDPDSMVDVLGSLVARSLVDVQDRGSHTRYRLLETVRIYMQDRLVAAGEATAVRDAHAEWCLRRGETLPDGRDAPGLRLWFSYGSPDLVEDLSNIRQAADWWIAQGRAELVARIAVATAPAFGFQGRGEEVREALETALAHEAELPRPLRVRCHSAWAGMAEGQGDFFVANERARTAIELAEDPAEAGAAYSLLVANLNWIDADEAERLLSTASRWAACLGPQAEDYIHFARGELAMARHDYDRAVALLSRATKHELFPTLEYDLVVAHLLRGDSARAEAILEASAPGKADVGRVLEYSTSVLRALIRVLRGDQEGARTQLTETLAHVRRWKVPLGLADCVLGCAVIAFHEGDTRRASELLEAVRAATGGGLRSPMSMAVYRRYVRMVRRTLDRDTVAEARAAGAALTLEAAITRELTAGEAGARRE